jgi:hypothetical protein
LLWCLLVETNKVNADCADDLSCSCCIHRHFVGPTEECICNQPCCVGPPCRNGTDANNTVVELLTNNYDVFSIVGSPVTAQGALNLSLVSQPPHYFLAGPAFGINEDTPEFRPLDVLDVPLNVSFTVSQPSVFSVFGSPLSNGDGHLDLVLVEQLPGKFLASDAPPGLGLSVPGFRSISRSDLPEDTGTVLNVSLVASPPGVFRVSGSPVNTSGALQLEMSDQPPNFILAGPSSGSVNGTVGYRALVLADMPAGLGSVTNVSMEVPSYYSVTGPILSSGTLSVTANAQAANTFLAGPTSGGSSTPDFRYLVNTDLPAGTGTVTSVALVVPSFYSVSGSPVTTSGALTVTANAQSANMVLAGPTNGAASTPSYRSLVTADLPLGTGTVTNVSIAMPTEFVVSGSPVTTNGTVVVTKATQSSRNVYAGPVFGSVDAEPSFRRLQPSDVAGTFVGSLSITNNSTLILVGSGAPNVLVTVECSGAGGAGGGAPATGASSSSVGSGGGSGGYAMSSMVNVPAPVSITTIIGAGGTGVNGAAGNAGGTTTLSINGVLFMSCPGGSGGGVVAAASGSPDMAMIPGGAGGATPTVTGGVRTLAFNGSPGEMGVAFASAIHRSASGGAGASSPNGGGATGTRAADLTNPSASTPGIAANNYASGGSGAANTVSSAAVAGGAGSAGYCYVSAYIFS